MVQAIQPSTAERKLAAFSPSLKNHAVALCSVPTPISAKISSRFSVVAFEVAH